MRRRDFIAGVGTAAASSFAARAQQSMPLVGFMTSRSATDSEPHTASFLRGLREAGFVPGENIKIEYRFANGRYDQLPEIAAELLKMPLTVLAAMGGEPSALAAKHLTTTVPIVFVIGGDPVKTGLTASLNRPNTNATGISFVTAELGGKRASLISEMVPSAKTIALLVNPKMSQTDAHVESARLGAQALGRRLLVLNASAPAEFESAFSTMAKESAGALVVQNDPFFDSQRDQLLGLTARHSLPAIYHIREYPIGGGLMSYGASLLDAYRQASLITARILKGERPQDIPVLQPTKFELVINSRTARSLRLTISPQMLAVADEVIE
jgi:putative ABC transport system substrate-binding protein